MKNNHLLLLISVKLLILTGIIAYLYVYDVENKPFSFGLDLAGGAQVVYIADTEGIPSNEIKDRISALQGVIERRVNALGVSEPRVYINSSSKLLGLPVTHKLVVELPGVTDIEEAIRAIGETPYIEFKIFNNEINDYVSVGLQGGQIVSSSVSFQQGVGGALTNEPVVLINFNSEGGKLFGQVTKDNIGNRMGIFLDGVLISDPVIREVIFGGTTQISGNFTIESATTLSNNISFGALPLPIELASTRTVSPTLGSETISLSVKAALIAFAFISLLFLIVYRFVGMVAILALISYIVVVLSIFKGIPIILTAAGLAGFIISIGFAVDANVLIFERIREELQDGKSRSEAISSGFSRAWLAIRDANTTSLIIAVLLFWFGTSIIKGFAFAFLIGVLVSMLSAYTLTRLFLNATVNVFSKKKKKWYIK